MSYPARAEGLVNRIFPSYIFFTRYIDDILMLTSSQRRTTSIYEKFQNIDRPIQFKLEHPDNTGSLSLLDFKMLMQISPRYLGQVQGSFNKFLDILVWTLLLIVYTWNSSSLRSNLLQLQCTCCTVPTTSGRPHGSPLMWACQWPSSQPISSLQLSQTYEDESS